MHARRFRLDSGAGADSVPPPLARRLSKRKAFKVASILRRTEVLPVEEELELDVEEDVEEDVEDEEEAEE